MLKLTLIPPSPISDKTRLEIRGSVKINTNHPTNLEYRFYVDGKDSEHLIKSERISIENGTVKGLHSEISTEHIIGIHKIILEINHEGNISEISKQFEVISSDAPSLPIIGGAWVGLYHWSEQEGKLWNEELKKFTEENWRELVGAMHEIGMSTIVIQEVFRNQQYHGKHNIPKKGYHGKAFYPSDLYPGRMEIATNDPIEVILSESEKYGMQVFLGVGHYAWFDFTPGALEWHKKVMYELWARYKDHPSLYGWYVSAEVQGSLQPAGLNLWYLTKSRKRKLIEEYQKEIITFFKELHNFSNRFALEMPIMLATNCHNLKGTEKIYDDLMKYLDIICPFGFHRMPNNDLSGEEAAKFLQNICDKEKSHLWLDLEIFLFGKFNELYPRPISGLVDDLKRFSNFEKILCYQFPGLMNPPWGKSTPGGGETIKLYEDYMKYYQNFIKKKEPDT